MVPKFGAKISGEQNYWVVEKLHSMIALNGLNIAMDGAIKFVS